MKELIKKFTRITERTSDFLVLATFLAFIIAVGGGYLGEIINNLPFMQSLGLLIAKGNEEISAFLLRYCSNIGVWIVCILIFLISYNRPMMERLYPNRIGNNLKGLLIGFLMGFVSNAICVLISVLKHDIRLSFAGFDPLLFICFMLAVLIQSSGEELVMRLYLYQKLRRRYTNVIFIIIAVSFVFMFMHAWNPGFTIVAGSQIFLSSVIGCLLVYYYDSIWMAFTHHMAWNFTQSIIFGLPNSGKVSAYSLFALDEASARNGLFYNVDFGVEGSIGSSLVLLVMVFVIIYINRDKTERNDIWADLERAQLLKAEQNGNDAV